ncbi:LTA synthase family protein [Anaerosacchariphilus polymeriproducens]|uniref:Alkaline phosphatase family protein n=1 Tax=Anaerosacchariphilus polymeriproducens TaxID=1812858 RepID=A0A371AW30_9FIRM|nr:alkaline phosphatase family protein [Anaerosacchariphilus polymeriproducens]RDU23776.1 alkaline phosphatase family protein [Anaerosacchariphilus polymeriproducens]
MSFNKDIRKNIIKVLITIVILILYLKLLSYGSFTIFNIKKLCCSVLVIASIALIWIKNPLNEKWNQILAWILFWLSPLVSYALIEFFNGTFFFKMELLSIFLNLFIYITLLLLFLLITNRVKIAPLILLWTSFLFGIISFNVCVFRGSALVVSDFAAISTAASVADEYHFKMREMDYFIFFSYLLFSVAICKVKYHKKLNWKIRVANLAVFLLLAGYFVNTFYLTNQTVKWNYGISIWNPQKTYRKIGTALTLAISGKFLFPEKPDGYTVEKVREITQPYIEKKEKESQISAESPNVIVIMNEAFSDFSMIGDFKVNQDYLPFFRSLKENTIKGKAYVSVLGGRTANSEFEFLTGTTLAFFPKSSVPLQLYVKKKIPSINYIFRDQGYSGISALHPYKPEGWGRNKAYPLLGFDSFITRDAFKDPELVRKYISDKEDFNKVIEEYENSQKESSAPFYMFNVTMQNHGGYSTNYDNLPRIIKVTDKELNQEQFQVNEVENYLNLIKKSDSAFEYLIKYFEKVDRPTIIVMYGDHQPLIAKFQKRLSERDGSSEKLYNYQVPFIIWANYEIDKKKIEKTSLNYLSSHLMDIAGVQKTAYQEYLLDLYHEIPVINAFGYFGSDGKFYEFDDMKSPYYEKIKEYRYLQYNQMFDTKNRIDAFFFLNKE